MNIIFDIHHEHYNTRQQDGHVRMCFQYFPVYSSGSGVPAVLVPPVMCSLSPVTSILRKMRPRRSVWSVPHRLGTLTTHCLCTFMSQAGERGTHTHTHTHTNRMNAHTSHVVRGGFGWPCGWLQSVNAGMGVNKQPLQG